MQLLPKPKAEWWDDATCKWDEESETGFLYVPNYLLNQGADHADADKLFVINDLDAFIAVRAFVGATQRMAEPTGVRKLFDKFRRQKMQFAGTRAVDLSISSYKLAQEPTPELLQKRSRGHVVHAEKKAVYTPNRRRKGGAVVKSMPRQLRRMKEAQEKAPAE